MAWARRAECPGVLDLADWQEREERAGCSSDGAGDRAGRGALFETLSTGACLTDKDVP